MLIKRKLIKKKVLDQIKKVEQKDKARQFNQILLTKKNYD
jgi:hypothetical protein